MLCDYHTLMLNHLCMNRWYLHTKAHFDFWLHFCYLSVCACKWKKQRKEKGPFSHCWLSSLTNINSTSMWAPTMCHVLFQTLGSCPCGDYTLVPAHTLLSKACLLSKPDWSMLEFPRRPEEQKKAPLLHAYNLSNWSAIVWNIFNREQCLPTKRQESRTQLHFESLNCYEWFSTEIQMLTFQALLTS